MIVGTDTGVGKTVVTALVALHFQARGIDCGVMKPFASGCEMFDGELESEDARFLVKATGVADAMDLINPARWREPLTPLIAAQRANDESDYWSRARAALGVLQARHEMIIVEGVGGLLAPITERNGNFLSNLDWAKECELPVLLVARRSLGTINHTLLTVGVLRAHGVETQGLIFCDAEPAAEDDVAAQTSPALIAEISGLPILGKVPFVEDLSRASLQKVARRCFGKTLSD
jgi:dethiobiotin synthetase